MNPEKHTPQIEQELNINRPIAELLPRYYETHGENPTFEVERSIPIDGHEVAWMHYKGTVTYDITGRGQEGKPYEGYELECACKFTEDVGWRIDEKSGTPVGLMGGDRCIKKDAAVYLRQLELREEYKGRGMLHDVEKNKPENVAAVMLDLIAKSEADEFLEGNSGAAFWGGHYYLQTVRDIMDIPMKKVWEGADLLLAEKRITLEGMVVQTYREPEQADKYEQHEVPEATLYHERPDKIWALVPRPEERELNLQEISIDDKNHWSILGRCILGLAHTPELAQARLNEAIANPRTSYERLYQKSFIETGYHAGVLAVIAYTDLNSSQPEEWVVEGFLGDAVVPETHTLPMYHPTIFGIDVDDYAHLEAKIEEWWPSA